MFPMHQISTTGVAPMQLAPVISIGIVLIKEVIIPIVIDRAIRIIHPVGRRSKMIDGPGWVGGSFVYSRGDTCHCLGNRWVSISLHVASFVNKVTKDTRRQKSTA